jgi:uncharacterized protein with ParB-like and HNH nuclease domain
MSVAIDTSPTTQEYEVIDGQQRMTTISLLFAAIIKKLSEKDISLVDEQKDELYDLKRRLIYKDKARLIPQVQGNNRDDYNAVLNELGLYAYQRQPYAGNRKIFKAYNFFQDELDDVMADSLLEDKATVIFAILQKILSAIVVNIIVDDYSDAFIMFESLNNRGEPLSAIDLIKNSLLAKLGKADDNRTDFYYQQWGQLINYLGSDYAVQERFFRQYYNAFVDDYRDILQVANATRSNLIKIYETIVKSNADGFLKIILEAGRIYSHIIGNPDQEDNNYFSLRKSVLDLSHIQGAPSYVLLLYLLMRQKNHDLTEDHLKAIINCLIKFFVRRNVTNIPATYELPIIFRDIIQGTDGKTSNDLVSYITDFVISRSPPDEIFKEKLQGSMYLDNVGSTRFILCYIEEQHMTKETWLNLWKQEGRKYLWTIEHIFPEGENIPQAWIDMIANGDKDKAKEIWTSYVHKLGNLSISGFNSKLSNRPFIDKRDLKDEKGQYIGYRNGIKLNEDLINKDIWTKECIDERTVKIVSITLDLFKYR